MTGTALVDTGFTAIGNGAAGGFVNGYLTVIIGPVFAEIERERRDGPRYVEAVTGARRLRFLAAWRDPEGAIYSQMWPSEHPAIMAARERGIPLGWITRP
jgi:hypothetical protein